MSCCEPTPRPYGRVEGGEPSRGLAGTFSGRARFAQPALVDGAAGAVWAPGGRPLSYSGSRSGAEKIVAIDLVADSERLDELNLAIIDD